MTVNPSKIITPWPDHFRAFYVERNRGKYGDNYPCPLGTRLEEMHVVMAETIADYMDAINVAAHDNLSPGPRG